MHEPQLKLIVLKSSQVESLRDFYAQLGFQFAEEQHGSGPTHFSASLGDGVLEVYPLPDGTEPDSTTRLGFRVSDLASALNGLGENCEPRQCEWGLRSIVRDPDGRTVELYQSS